MVTVAREPDFVVGSLRLVFGVRVQEGFSRWSQRTSACCWSCLRGGYAVFIRDHRLRPVVPQRIVLTCLCFRRWGWVPAGDGTAGVPEPGLMGRRQIRGLLKA